MPKNSVPLTIRMSEALALKLDAAVEAERETEIVLGQASRSSIIRKALAGYLEAVEAGACATVARR